MYYPGLVQYARVADVPSGLSPHAKKKNCSKTTPVPVSYAEVTVRSLLDGGDAGTIGFPLSAYTCISPPAALARQLVASEDYLYAILNILVNRMATYLEGKRGTYSGGGSSIFRGRREELLIHETSSSSHSIIVLSSSK